MVQGQWLGNTSPDLVTAGNFSVRFHPPIVHPSRIPMQETSSITLATPVQSLPGVGPSRADRLRRLGLRTARDVLFLFPRDYEHPAPSAAVSDLQAGVPAALVGEITDAEIVSRTPGKSVFGAIVENETVRSGFCFSTSPFVPNS